MNAEWLLKLTELAKTEFIKLKKIRTLAKTSKVHLKAQSNK